MRLSVVIPTFERLPALQACLASIAAQEPEGCVYEVVVADDGSGDRTFEWLTEASQQEWPFRLRVLQCPHRGPAAARNAGVREASGDVILFTGDDCVLAPGCIERHHQAHEKWTTGTSVLGFTTWLPSLDIHPFMHFQENGGSQFAYWRIADREDAGWLNYYTTHISTPRMALLENPFDERFPAARYEDLELGYRLEQRGHRIVYEPEALIWHDHPLDCESFLRQCEGFGQHAVLFHQLHPADEGLAQSLGIRDAEQADRVFGPALEAADQLVKSLEAKLVDAPATSFGVRGGQSLLHDAYRLLTHHALIGGIRKALSLPAPVVEF